MVFDKFNEREPDNTSNGYTIAVIGKSTPGVETVTSILLNIPSIIKLIITSMHVHGWERQVFV